MGFPIIDDLINHPQIITNSQGRNLMAQIRQGGQNIKFRFPRDRSQINAFGIDPEEPNLDA